MDFQNFKTTLTYLITTNIDNQQHQFSIINHQSVCPNILKISTLPKSSKRQQQNVQSQTIYNVIPFNPSPSTNYTKSTNKHIYNTETVAAIPLDSPVTQMISPEKGPVVFATLNGDSETAAAEVAGDCGSNENAGIPLNDEEKSTNSFEHPLPAITSTLPPITLPPIFSIIQSTNVIELQKQI